MLFSHHWSILTNVIQSLVSIGHSCLVIGQYWQMLFSYWSMFNNYYCHCYVVINVHNNLLYMSLLFQTNDVNQGDALEHDFSTLYLALTFPVKHVLDTSLPQVCLPQYIFQSHSWNNFIWSSGLHFFFLERMYVWLSHYFGWTKQICGQTSLRHY